MFDGLMLQLSFLMGSVFQLVASLIEIQSHPKHKLVYFLDFSYQVAAHVFLV
jgi:hypothetical protein